MSPPLVELHLTCPFKQPAAAVWKFHAAPGALHRLLPPWQDVALDSWKRTPSQDSSAATGTYTGMASLADALVTLRLGPTFLKSKLMGDLRLKWLARHDPASFIDQTQFCDVQASGPFHTWRHTHRVDASSQLAPSGSMLTDHILYRLPLHPVAWPVAGWKIRSDLAKMFAFRHARTRHDVIRHNHFAHLPRQRIVITGSSGFIGSALTAYLLNAGHSVDRLVRREARPATILDHAALPGREFAWDPQASLPDKALIDAIDGADAIIHLAGEPVAAGRVDDKRLELIRSSRVRSTQLLVAAMGKCAKPPRTLISASGTNIYRNAGIGEAPRDEAGPLGQPGDRQPFADIARAWEAAALQAETLGARVVCARIGVVLGVQGPFMRRMRWALPPLLKLARVGTGATIVPWLHIDDCIAAIEHALHDDGLRGPVNFACGTQSTHSQVFAAINRIFLPPGIAVPAPVGLSRRIIGRSTVDALMESQPVIPSALAARGFRFWLSDLATAVGFDAGELSSIASAVRSLESIEPMPALPIGSSTHPFTTSTTSAST
jgi:uncharacterized protein